MLQKLIMSDPKFATKLLNSKGRSAALKAFKDAAKLPAYLELLKTHNVSINDIHSVADFVKLPILDKKNYINAFPLEDRIKFKMYKNYTIERSSGYSGEPNYWVRFSGQDDATEKRIVELIDKIFEIKTKKTLMINTFAMGTWIAGIKSARWFLNAANNKDLDLTVVNVGINLEESIEIFKKFYKHYDQTIFMGYNPFLKQIVDKISGQYDQSHVVHLLMGGEGFSEDWRDYIANKLGYRIEDFKGKVISGYGAADMGNDIGVEQPFSIMLRRAFTKKPELMKKYIGEVGDFVPLMFQYSPTKVFVETNDAQELIFTANSGAPLVRYNLHDKGGTISYLDALSIVEEVYGKDYVKNVLKPMPLPVIFLYGRSDSTIHVTGVNIYMEHIKQSVNNRDISEYTTGRFYCFVEDDENYNQRFNMVIEARDVKLAENKKSVIQKNITTTIANLNKEYKHLLETNFKLANPVINFVSEEEFEKYSRKSIKIVYKKN